MPQLFHAGTRVKILEQRDDDGNKLQDGDNLTGREGFLAKPARINSESFQVQIGPVVWTLPSDRIALIREGKKGRAA